KLTATTKPLYLLFIFYRPTGYGSLKNQTNL
ncbi:MAG: hypothetical protein ACI9FJ_002577, partial [Alteromonadaceae bacterium]